MPPFHGHHIEMSRMWAEEGVFQGVVGQLPYFYEMDTDMNMYVVALVDCLNPQLPG